jgi:polyisoprenyl-phosphate glycosyltransferase
MDVAETLLSVVVPCYNEAAVLPLLHDRLTATLAAQPRPYELILVNDGSRDDTWAIMQQLAANDARLVVVNLSRNHGHQLALTAGLSVARGAHVAVIDADLQDPPEILPQMLTHLLDTGADVVYGRRLKRAGETWFKRTTAHLFYRTLDRLTDIAIPLDTGDFRIMTRRAVDHFLAMPERHRFVRGMVSWIGYRQEAFPYERHARAAGETHYTLRKMLKLAWDAITSFSTKPLALPGYLAGASAALGAALVIGAVAWGFATNTLPSLGLFSALMTWLCSGIFASLHVLGQYVGRMATDIRGRPLFIIDRVVRGDQLAQQLPYRQAG